MRYIHRIPIAGLIFVALSLLSVLASIGSTSFTAQAQSLVPDKLPIPQIVIPTIPTYGAGQQVALAETAPLSTTFTYVGGYQTSIFADQLVVSGTLALVSDVTDGLRILDVRNPAQPQLLSTFRTPFRPSVLALEASLAAVADPGNGVYLVDLSDPTTPVQVWHYALNPDEYETMAIALSPNRLFISTKKPSVMIFDIQNPAAPLLLGTYEAIYASVIIPINDRMYLSGTRPQADNTQLEIIDIVDPAKPKLLGTIATSAQDSISLLQVVGTTAYLSGSNRYGPTAIVTVDIADPTAIYQIGGYSSPTPGRLFRGTAVYGGAIFAGIMNRDLTNPELFVLSTGDPVNLPRIDSYNVPQLQSIPNNLAVQGNYLYIAENTAGLRIYRINYPYRVVAPIVRAS